MAGDEAARETIALSSRRLAELLERYVPGLVSGLHLIGSASDGDFHAGRSDLDFVAVLSQPLSAADLEALYIVHRIYGSDPTLATLDGIWISEASLAAGPDAASEGPTTSDGQFLALAHGNRNPVTWRQLGSAVSVVGELDGDRLWHDAARLASWTRENVDSYWSRWLADSSRLLTGRGLAMLGRQAPMWGVLGISRLHYTLTTGEVTSKSGAGEYALTWSDERWHPIIRDCLLIRRENRSRYGGALRRRRDALQYVEMVIGDIRRRWPDATVALRQPASE